MTKPTVAVSFAAKSTEDTHGSIDGQMRDCRELAEREDLDLPADREFHDEKMSGWSGDRGPGLARALAECERLAAEYGSCALLLQHSDRLARGDGIKAKHLVEYALWALKANVTIFSKQDPQTFGDLLYAVVTGQRNHEDSARKSTSVRDGLQRRKEKGKPVGPVPLGYTVEKTVIEDKVVTKRTIDPVTRPTVERIFSMVERGMSFGDVARQLNAEGITGRRGNPWVRTTIRTIVNNAAYAGAEGLRGDHRARAVQDHSRPPGAPGPSRSEAPAGWA
jgi:DNA invertase Pin-like site-specific DNA recombinase